MHQQLSSIITKPSLCSSERWYKTVLVSYFIISILTSIRAGKSECIISRLLSDSLKLIILFCLLSSLNQSCSLGAKLANLNFCSLFAFSAFQNRNNHGLGKRCRRKTRRRSYISQRLYS